MANDDLGVPQRAALFALMAVGEEVSNPELQKRIGVDLKRPQREALVRRGLVTAWYDGRRYVLELTDEGWRWCADELGADCPPRTGSAGAALYAVLAGLGRYVARTGLTLADVFGPAPVRDASTAPADTPAHDANTALADTPAHAPARQHGTAQARVEQAYQTLALAPQSWVSLTALRAAVAELPRDQVDEALRALAGSQRARLVPQANQKVLTEADRAAALWYGNEDNHHVAIGEA